MAEFDWSTWFEHAAASDVGMRRANNQDAFRVVLAGDEEQWQARGHIFMVADGMGAHAAGELASKLAVDNVPHLYRKHRDLSPPEAIEKAIIETNTEINRRGQANPDFHNMGTTCSTMMLLPQGVVLGHVGDSRIYRTRNNLMEQITFDHSLVWEMQAAGQLTEGSDAAAKVPKNVITRSLGPNRSVQVDLEGPHAVEQGDCFLLCSDGLTGPVTDEELAPIMNHLPAEEAVALLIDLANLRGGPDNITVIMVRITSGQCATANAATEPLRVGKKAAGGKVQPVVMILPVVSLIAAAIFAVMPVWPLALAGLAAAALTGGIAAFQKWGGGNEGTALGGGHALGKGPYTRTPAKITKKTIDTLADIVRELREAAQQEHWEVDWEKLDTTLKPAEKAVAENNLVSALSNYGKSVSFMMRELRAQRERKAEDSNIF